MIDKCPCEDCLFRSLCNQKLYKEENNTHLAGPQILLLLDATNCSFLGSYIGEDPNSRFEKIDEARRVFNLTKLHRI
jgi:hypothetical protein